MSKSDQISKEIETTLYKIYLNRNNIVSSKIRNKSKHHINKITNYQKMLEYITWYISFKYK
jgi:hypothetical protein